MGERGVRWVNSTTGDLPAREARPRGESGPLLCRVPMVPGSVRLGDDRRSQPVAVSLFAGRASMGYGIERNLMKKTVGSTDKIVRTIIAVVAVVVAGFAGFSSVWGIVLVIVAAIMVVTASGGYCPIYSATGISTAGDDGHRHGANAH